MTDTQNEMTLLEQLASDYVMGSLPDTEREIVKQRLKTDQELQAEVSRWQNLLASMNATVGEASPAADTWKQIEQRLGWGEAPKNKWAAALDNVAFWRGTAFASIMLLMLTWGGSFLPTDDIEFMPDYSTVLAGTNGENDWLVRVDTKRNIMEVSALREMDMPDDMTPQLWRVSSKGEVMSLGMPAKKRVSYMPLNKAMFAPDGEMAMTLEPMEDDKPQTPNTPLTCKGGIKRL